MASGAASLRNLGKFSTRGRSDRENRNGAVCFNRRLKALGDYPLVDSSLRPLATSGDGTTRVRTHAVTCSAVLSVLIDARFLFRTRDGAFMRIEYATPLKASLPPGATGNTAA
jgi:hypothetical protein